MDESIQKLSVKTAASDVCRDFSTVKNHMVLVIIRLICKRVVSIHYWKLSGIQVVTGGTDQTSGECSLGQTIPT